MYLTFTNKLVFCPDATFTFNFRNSRKFVARTTAIINLISIKVFALGTASSCNVGKVWISGIIATWRWKFKNSTVRSFLGKKVVTRK